MRTSYDMMQLQRKAAVEGLATDSVFVYCRIQ
ncbi:hypothetical protein R2601_22711 [Salipiger bermudensis HTCC2601]|uniref:Uncharacterized protein n=1 Tax=Salipiger bermudensis (strain DSM 26914 / JCM 13377 / KCTC 12554 / HTCC2601) TaxID=314265 RepID=Q0FLQ1_SALBH|nr:hypothetical protein R2601_22711 [Salipiger bermudensis HTCC2601]